jgi:hypothetical protein
MKLYSISKLVFWSVMILILLLPAGRHWRLLSTGVRTEGTVLGYTLHKHIDMFGGTQLIWASEVRFQVGDSAHLTLGPIDLELKQGKTIPVYYKSGNPSKNCLFNFSCLYYTSYAILPLILMVVWYAFYLSYNNYQREKQGKSRTPASSPYVPFGRNAPNSQSTGDKRRGIKGKSEDAE